MNKTCKQCSQSFEITEEDLQFYGRVSPVFAGKKFLIPAPTLCPDCRQQRRLSFRNERKLYQRNCDRCQKNMVSLYHLKSPYTVYCQSCWWSDEWDPFFYGRSFDFQKSFFEQFKELQKVAPRVALFNLHSVNSDYTNHSANNKNCYMGVAIGECEDVLYGHWVTHSRDTVDGLYLDHCEQCYECSYCENCYRTFYSQYCKQLRDSFLCYECRDCEYCIACVQLQHKKYHIFNKPVSPEIFEQTKNELLSSPEKFKAIQEKFIALKRPLHHRTTHQVNCENSSGDDLYNCKNAQFCFNCRNLEDCKYIFDLGDNKDSMDCYEHGWLVPSALNYEAHAGMAGYHFLFCNICADSHDLTYCDLCFNNSANLFGCVGLKKKSYCILNVWLHKS